MLCIADCGDRISGAYAVSFTYFNALPYMRSHQKEKKYPFRVYSLSCTCDPSRLIQDKANILYCENCMEKLERIPGDALLSKDKEEILRKLNVYQKLKK